MVLIYLPSKKIPDLVYVESADVIPIAYVSGSVLFFFLFPSFQVRINLYETICLFDHPNPRLVIDNP